MSEKTSRERATTAKRESKHVEFKEQFDPSSDAEWCELLKDFAAIANSGGGIVVIGVRNNGSTSGCDISAVLDLDPAKVTDKLFKYTGRDHAGFEILDGQRDGQQVAVVSMDPVTVPLVFTKPGTYLESPGRQKTAFSMGTVYFRHGAKSEPATSDDLRDFIERRIESVRGAWLGKVRQVIEAPMDAQVAVYRPTTSDTGGPPTRIQLTTDANAPVYGKLDADVSHPHRQKEVLSAVNARLPKKVRINTYDIQCIRKVYRINAKTSPQFCHLPKFGSMQYSEAFIDWIVDQYAEDLRFFDRTRARLHDLGGE